MPGTAHREAPAAQRWAFTLTVALLFAGTFLRSVLEFEGSQLGLVSVLLGVWVALLVTEGPLSRLWEPWFAVYVVLQAVVVGVLLGRSDDTDYFAILLAVPCMQAMQRWRPSAALALIAVFAVLIAVRVDEARGAAVAISLAAVYTAASLFLASYALTARRATEAQAHERGAGGRPAGGQPAPHRVGATGRASRRRARAAAPRARPARLGRRRPSSA